MSEIAPPQREGEVALPQCRCVVIRRGVDPNMQRDRCGGTVDSPDSPRCKPCEIEHNDTEDPDYEYRLVPLDHERSNHEGRSARAGGARSGTRRAGSAEPAGER